LRPQRTAEGADAWFGPDLIVVKSWKFEEFAGATLTGVNPNNAEAADRQNG
jgi:hypothetical protein